MSAGMSHVNNLILIDMFSFLPVAKETASSSSEHENNDELEQITIARALLNYRLKEKIAMSNSNAPIPFPRKLHIQNPRSSSPQPPPVTTSKILPLICQRVSPRSRHLQGAAASDNFTQTSLPENRGPRPMKFPAAGAAPYVPIRQMRSPCRGIAPPVTIRTAVPVFSAPPLPPSAGMSHQMIGGAPVQVAPPVNIRQAIPVFAAPPARKDELVLPARKDEPAPPVQKDEPAPPVRKDEPAPITKEDPITVSAPSPLDEAPAKPKETDEISAKPQEKDTTKTENITPESQTVQSLEQLKI